MVILVFRACGLFVLIICLLISSNALAQIDKCIAVLNAIERGDPVEVQELANAIKPIIAEIGKDLVSAGMLVFMDLRELYSNCLPQALM